MLNQESNTRFHNHKRSQFRMLPSKITLSSRPVLSKENTFSNDSGLRAQKYQLSGSELSEQHIQELRDVFSLFDNKNKKTIDVQELKVISTFSIFAIYIVLFCPQ